MSFPEELRADLESWVEQESTLALADLRFPEVRRAVQALSTLYVQKRARGGLERRAGDGAGKRAAFASYYAPLHFMAAAVAADEVRLAAAEAAAHAPLRAAPEAVALPPGLAMHLRRLAAAVCWQASGGLTRAVCGSPHKQGRCP